MTDIRTLDTDESLDAVRTELKFTERRLRKHPDTSALAAPFNALLTRLATVRDAQQAAWDAEDDADVDVAEADDALDDAVTVVERALLGQLNKDHPQYKRFFGDETPRAIQRLGLQSELERLRTWPASLDTTSPAAKTAGATLAQAITAGDAAIAARAAAAGRRADQRVREVLPLLEDANALRRSTYGALIQQGATAGLPSGWSNRFFRRGRVRPRKTEA